MFYKTFVASFVLENFFFSFILHLSASFHHSTFTQSQRLILQPDFIFQPLRDWRVVLSSIHEYNEYNSPFFGECRESTFHSFEIMKPLMNFGERWKEEKGYSMEETHFQLKKHVPCKKTNYRDVIGFWDFLTWNFDWSSVHSRISMMTPLI